MSMTKLPETGLAATGFFMLGIQYIGIFFISLAAAIFLYNSIMKKNIY